MYKLKNITHLVAGCSLSFLLCFCNRAGYAESNRTYRKTARALTKEMKQQPSAQTFSSAPDWVGTTNFNLRKPNLVVIHHTAQNSCEQTLKTFTRARTSVSAHYVICKSGTVHHMLNDYFRAWHGGVGRWGGLQDINSSSIGIELDNNGAEPFTDTQMNSLVILLDTLKKRYGIPSGNFIGHADIAPTRKNDPNVMFPWKSLAEKGFGYWWSDTSGVQVPEGFNHLHALRIIGYDIRDSVAVIRAFNRKYLQQDTARNVDASGRKVLYTLYTKYL